MEKTHNKTIIKEKLLKIIIKFQLEKIYLKYKFKKNLGYSLDLDNDPKTYNQKIQIRKLFDKNPLYRICSDKIEVKTYIKNIIGEKYIIPTYLITDKLTEEEWKNLPEKFVIKANHNSGPVQIIKNKSKERYRDIYKELNRQLSIDYGVLSLEKYYSEIEPKIICEKLLTNKEGDYLKDYKLHCFNYGKDIYIDIIKRTTLNKTYSNIYTMNMEPLNATNAKELNCEVEKLDKKLLDELVQLAIKISKKFDYVRVDFYILEEKIYFGELTFCDSSGLSKFNEKKWDDFFGDIWQQNIVMGY